MQFRTKAFFIGTFPLLLNYHRHVSESFIFGDSQNLEKSS